MGEGTGVLRGLLVPLLELLCPGDMLLVVGEPVVAMGVCRDWGQSFCV